MQQTSAKLSNIISTARNSKLAALAAAFLLQTGCKQQNPQSANQKGFEQKLQQISSILKVRESYFAGSDRTVVIFSSIHRPEVEKKVAEKMSRLDKVFKLDIIGLEGNIHSTRNPADLQIATEYDKIFAAAEAIPSTLRTGDLIQVYTPIDNSGFRLNNYIENSGFNSIITGLETVDQKKAIKHKVIGVVIHKMDFIEQEIATKGHCVMAVGDKPTKHALELTTALDWLKHKLPRHSITQINQYCTSHSK